MKTDEICKSLEKKISRAITSIEAAIVCLRSKITKRNNKSHISFIIYEAPTEIVYGPNDGEQAYYGMKVNLKSLINNVKSLDLRFYDDVDGPRVEIKGIYKDCYVNISIVNMLESDDYEIAQKYDYIKEEYESCKIRDKILNTRS